MPAAIIDRKGVELVHDHRPQAAEPGIALDPGGDQHALDRFGRGQDDVGRVLQRTLLARLRHIAMPELHPSANESCVVFETLGKVVEQRLDRADVQHAHAAPVLAKHARQHRDDRRLGLATCSRRQQQAMEPLLDRADGLDLRRSQRRPAQRIDDVVLQRGVQGIERINTQFPPRVGRAHSAMSSTESAFAAARSAADISVSDSVRL